VQVVTPEHTVILTTLIEGKVMDWDWDRVILIEKPLIKYKDNGDGTVTVTITPKPVFADLNKSLFNKGKVND